MLSGIRALDLTDHKGWLCGRILADLGAEVIKVEPPGGDPGRTRPPFYRNQATPELSLTWFAYNLGKRGITLNLETGQGKDIFKRLTKDSDLVIESFAPGRMKDLGLASRILREINAGIIVTSISPFGQSGPYSHFKASDIVVMAMGGFMYVTGNPERPPLRVSFPFAYALASAQAAAGSLVAFWHRLRTGLGQDVDVSAQESVVDVLTNVSATWELNGIMTERVGPLFFRGGFGQEAHQRVVWPCKDGAVAYMAMGGRAGAASNKALVSWMDEEGMADDWLRSLDWERFDTVTLDKAFLAKLEKPIERFFKAHNKLELHTEAQKRKVFLQPVNTPREIVSDPQLTQRDYWIDLEHKEFDRVLRYPGSFGKASERTLRPRRRAPLVGEHNIDIYQDELGFLPDEIERLKQDGVI